jgi:hypothetical protein
MRFSRRRAKTPAIRWRSSARAVSFSTIEARIRASYGVATGASGSRPGFDPRRYVDAVARNSLAVGDHVADVDADAETHRARRRPLLVERGERPLGGEGALERGDRARELRQQIVADGVHDPAAELGHASAHLAPAGIEHLEGGRLVRGHQPRVAGDVRAEDGRQTARVG